MKPRFTFPVLIACSILLVGVTGWMLHKLLNISFPEPPSRVEPNEAVPAAEEAPSAFSETVIELATSPVGPPAVIPTEAVRHAEASVPAPAQPPKTADIGKIEILRGSAVATGTAQRRRILHSGDPVQRMETIETGPEARARVVFSDGTTLSVGANSTLILDDYVYNPSQADECNFAIRFAAGAFRVITGAIVKLNPSRFSVRMRMSTVGIRGCDLIFRNTPDQQEINVLSVSDGRTVLIETASDGTPLLNFTTGKPLPAASPRKNFTISQSGRILLRNGQPPEQKTLSHNDIDQLIESTSPLQSAQYNLIQRPDGAVLMMTPADQAVSANQAKTGNE